MVGCDLVGALAHALSCSLLPLLRNVAFTCHSCQLLTRLPLARVGLGLGAERNQMRMFLRIAP